MTRYAEVIGDPITQSKSPVLHRFWLAALGIDADYRAARVTAEELPDYFARRRNDPAWLGCNITKPLKIAALDQVEDRGGVRGSIGAINTAFRADDHALVGTNTDAAGFYAPIADLDIAGQPVTVVGSGGAARAVLFALARIEVGPVTLLVRNPLKGAGLLAAFGLKVPDRLPGDWAERLTAAPSRDTAAVVVASSVLFYLAERDHNPKVNDVFDAMVYCSTCLSVGYGDIFARTPVGKLIGTTLMTLGPALTSKTLDGHADAAADKAQSEILSTLKELLDRVPRKPQIASG